MDRWSDRDAELDGESRAGPRGKVAAQGMSAFVKSEVIGSQNAVVAGGVTVVPSRREQKKQEAVNLMPPPPAASRQPQSGAPSYTPPAWAAPPPDGFALHVYKDNSVVQEIPLGKSATVFGRHSGADVPLDHASLSRFHAAISYHKKLGRMMAVDLGSVHGTFVDGQRLKKDVPHELKPGCEIRFAASSRRYLLHQSAPSTTSPSASKRPRVKFADEDTGGGGLEQIIGYSDGGDFTARVGPSSSKPDDQGQFAALVKSTVLPNRPRANGADKKESRRENGENGGRRETAGDGAVKDKLKEVLEGKVKGPLAPFSRAGSLFDDLPPPSK